MKNKHEQLYVAVQDLLIGLGITPEKLRSLAIKDQTCTIYQGTITSKIAQKLIDADLIVEEVSWRKSIGVENKSESKAPLSKDAIILMFDKIKFDLAPETLWSYLQEKHSAFLSSKNNKLLPPDLAPKILWTHLRDEHPEFLLKQIKDHLFPSS